MVFIAGSERCGSTVLVDSPKSPRYNLFLALPEVLEIHSLRLVRDPRLWLTRGRDKG